MHWRPTGLEAGGSARVLHQLIILTLICFNNEMTLH